MPAESSSLKYFSIANFHNKLVILTGGVGMMQMFSEKNYALDLVSEEWKDQDTLPSLKTPRYFHSSCVLQDTLYVIAGMVASGNMQSNIELLSMKVNWNSSFDYIDKKWSVIHPEKLTPRSCPFVSAIGKKSLLVFGGDVADGVLINIETKNEKMVNSAKNLKIKSHSHGIMSRNGMTVGIGVD